MSDFAELRQLASQLASDIQDAKIPPADLPSVHHAAVAPFRDEVEQRLGALIPGKTLTQPEKDLLAFVFERNRGITPDEAAERLVWLARGPNAFYWGPWLPYQDP